MNRRNTYKPALIFLSVLFFIGFFSSCQISPEPDSLGSDVKKKRIIKRQIKGIGEVVSINRKDNFVLVDVRSPKLATQADSFYIEKSGRNAVLRPTGEKIGSYMAADIITGEVRLEDTVLVKITPPPPPIQPLPEQSEQISETLTENEKSDSETNIEEKVKQVESTTEETALKEGKAETVNTVVESQDENKQLTPAPQVSEDVIPQGKE